MPDAVGLLAGAAAATLLRSPQAMRPSFGLTLDGGRRNANADKRLTKVIQNPDSYGTRQPADEELEVPAE